MAAPTFIFGADGLPKTPQEAARLRAIAQAMAPQGAPKNVGEGLTSLGNAIAYRMMMNKAAKGDAMGQNAANSAFTALMSGFGGGSSPASPSATPAPSTPTGQPPVPGIQSQGGDMEAYRNAIASIESAGSGDYAAVGPTHPKMGRALGRYQVMEANIGPWSQEVLGRTVTPEEFMANPQLQDQIFDGKFKSYVSKYGPEGAAQAWFGGPGGVGKTDRTDSLGTSIGEYGNKFSKAIGSVDAVNAMGADTGRAPVAQALAGMKPVEVAGGTGRQGIMAALMGGQPQTQDMPTDYFPAAPSAPGQAGPSPQQIMQVLTNPYASPEQKAIAQDMYQQMQQSRDPMRQLEMQKMQLELQQMQNPQPEYDIISGKDGSIFRADKKKGTVEQVYGGKPDTFRTLTDAEEQQFGLDPSKAYQIGADNKIQQIGGGGTTVNIDQKAEGAFDKKLAEKQAESLDAMATEGMNARADLGVIEELGTLMAGKGGTLDGISGALAKYGIGGDGIGDIQAAQALINRLVPTQRQPGSGSMSDRDVELFTRSLPSLWNQPGGNERILNTMRGLAQYKQAQGDIAQRVMTGEIDRQTATKMLRELPNPLANFKPEAKAEIPPAPPGFEDDWAEIWAEMPEGDRKLWMK